MTDFPLPHFSTDLSGQTALVTGASAGLGQRFARVLAKAGAKVALTARRVDKLEALAAEIRQSGGVAEVFALDVTDGARCEAVVAEAEAKLGPISILINNAGMPDAQRAHKMPVELIDQVLNTNVRAPFILATAVARRLIAQKLPGRIVNISSMSGYYYDGNGAALYSVTKAAVARMVEALAVEWAGYHINVTGIAPGVFKSEMMDGMIARIGAPFWEKFPRKRMGEAAQLDSTLLYLVSPASEAVTGTIIKVDDGQLPR